jgi:hypothetical protein
MLAQGKKNTTFLSVKKTTKETFSLKINHKDSSEKKNQRT